MIAGIVASGRLVVVPPPDPEAGQPYGGGYYAGKMNYGVPGEDYRLIVAPEGAIAPGLDWKTSDTVDAANSVLDGWANSEAKNTATYPAIKACRDYRGGGFDDWYMPSYYEMLLLMYKFKLTTATNDTTTPTSAVPGYPIGQNPHSIPPIDTWTLTDPASRVSELPGDPNLYGINPDATYMNGTSTVSLDNPRYYVKFRQVAATRYGLPINDSKKPATANPVYRVRAVRRELIVP